MGQLGSMIADASSVGLRYAKRLIDNIPDDLFSKMARPGNQLIVSNHPAFGIGHLCLYPSRVTELLGKPTAESQAPANYSALFSKDAQCQDDPAGSVYPPKGELVSVFERTYEAAINSLRECDDQLLMVPNPVDSPIRAVCPTLGSMLMFYMTGHVMSHLGQISTWRRMQGLPPA